VEFISYESSFVADSGQAAGLLSTDIGVRESGSTTATGESLQRIGSGSGAGDFAWSGPAPASPGQLNAGQTMVPPGDPDFDGLPSDWETLYFGGPTNAVAGEDVDLDGFTNYEEYIADTNPIDPASFLRIISVAVAPQPGIAIESSSIRVYSLESAMDAVDTNGWGAVSAEVPGTGGLLLLVDTNAVGSARYYRSRVTLP
jgi:hypothetical protein